MVVKVKDAETKRNKASAAHTGWKKRTKTSTTTPKKVYLYSSSLQLKAYSNPVFYLSTAVKFFFCLFPGLIYRKRGYSNIRKRKRDRRYREEKEDERGKQQAKGERKKEEEETEDTEKEKVACNYFFNRKFANQRAIVQQVNHIHRVTGLVVWRKEGWWEALLQSFSPLSRSYHVSFSLSFPSSPAYCRYFWCWLSPVSLLRSLLSLLSSYKSSCRLHKYERAFFGVVVCATLD